MSTGFVIENHKVANDIALKWFEIHAAQRLTMFNFFVVISGFCLAGYFTALDKGHGGAASIVALGLVAICFCFRKIDERTSQLVKIGETYLRNSLPALQAEIGIPDLNVVDKAEEKGAVWSYTKSFRFLFVLFGIFGVVGVIYPFISIGAVACGVHT